MRRVAAGPWPLLALTLACGVAACGRSAPAPAPAEPAGEAISSTTQTGPVKATVSLRPKAPRLGDPLWLTLTVEADTEVTVEMPPFGEALGRFSIVNFTPRSEARAGGGARLSQRYQLEAPMSGRLRIPPLRVEFSDRRGHPGGGAAAPDGGPAPGGDEPHELLTDELSVDVASVLPGGEAEGPLRGLRGPLPERLSDARGVRYAVPAALLLLLGAGVLLVRRLRRVVRVQQRRSAGEVALGRLAELSTRGVPAPEAADSWYVDLSDIVRRYIEDRYRVRAPELTTEEFLREAQALLLPDHRRLLGAFLSTCDQVKFAAYRPAAEESHGALATARRFVEETAKEAGP